MTNLKLQRIVFLFVAICYGLLALNACNNNPTSSYSQGSITHDGTNMTVNILAPADIAALAISGLQAQVTIDGSRTYPLDVDPITNEVSGTISGVSTGTHDLEVTYFVAISGVDVILCAFSTQVTVNTGQSTSVTILDEDLDRNIDDDNDGYTNLAEVRIGTNPISNHDYPEGESPFVICGNGTTQIVSSGNYTISLISGSTIAGSATSSSYEITVPLNSAR